MLNNPERFGTIRVPDITQPFEASPELQDQLQSLYGHLEHSSLHRAHNPFMSFSSEYHMTVTGNDYDFSYNSHTRDVFIARTLEVGQEYLLIQGSSDLDADKPVTISWHPSERIKNYIRLEKGLPDIYLSEVRLLDDPLGYNQKNNELVEEHIKELAARRAGLLIEDFEYALSLRETWERRRKHGKAVLNACIPRSLRGLLSKS
jgi:hypothetical protein